MQTEQGKPMTLTLLRNGATCAAYGARRKSSMPSGIWALPMCRLRMRDRPTVALSPALEKSGAFFKRQFAADRGEVLQRAVYAPAFRYRSLWAR